MIKVARRFFKLRRARRSKTRRFDKYNVSKRKNQEGAPKFWLRRAFFKKRIKNADENRSFFLKSKTPFRREAIEAFRRNVPQKRPTFKSIARAPSPSVDAPSQTNRAEQTGRQKLPVPGPPLRIRSSRKSLFDRQARVANEAVAPKVRDRNC